MLTGLGHARHRSDVARFIAICLYKYTLHRIEAVLIGGQKMSRGLGSTQRAILSIVCDFPEWGASVKYIHNLTKQHKASVSRGITSLEKRNLVYRVENEDRVKPTPAGIDYHLKQLEKTHAI